jgi:hypothetical protein
MKRSLPILALLCSAAVSSGGQLKPDSPPAVKDGSLAGAVEVPTDERVGWPGPVNGFAPAFAPEPQPIDLKGKRAVGVTVPLDGRRWLVEAARAPDPATARRTVHVIDARTGEAGTAFDLPAKRVLFGETATSDAVLTVGAPDAAGGGERLELFATDGQPVGSWRPHPEAKPDPTRSSILYAAALSTSRAITIGTARVTLWQLPEAKAVWTTRIPDASGGGLSPDGTVLFVPHGGGVRALNVETGGTVGNVKADPIKHGGDEQMTVAVSGDGTRLATLSGLALARALRVWDLSDGKLLMRRHVTVYGDTAVLRFLGPRFLLLGDTVFDLTDFREVWRVKPDVGGVVAQAAPADGRVWFAFASEGDTRLHAAAFPADQLARFLTDYAKTGAGVFQKGEKVKVVIEPPADAPPGWESLARTAARFRLADVKLTEDSKATTVVTVTFRKVPDTPVKVKWQRGEGVEQEETIDRFAVEGRAVVTRDGRVVYTAPPVKAEMRVQEWPQVNEITDTSKTAQEFFTRQVWNDAGAAAGYVFDVAGGGIEQPNGTTWRLPGEATLTRDGLAMNWPVGQSPQAGGGNLSVPTPAAKPDGPPQNFLLGCVCLVGMVVTMLVVVALALWWQRRRWEEAHPKPPFDDYD